MTGTNHALTGAAIALVLIDKPVVAISAALASHFVLDAIPHFWIYEDTRWYSREGWLLRGVVIGDLVLLVSLFIMLPALIYSYSSLAWWTVLGGMAAAVLPDLVWIPWYVHELRTKTPLPSNWYAKLHKAIQWERPWGLIVEIAWLCGSVVVVLGLIR
jgi:hypothetical protein